MGVSKNEGKPSKWMVHNGKSLVKMDDLGVPSYFFRTPKNRKPYGKNGDVHPRKLTRTSGFFPSTKFMNGSLLRTKSGVYFSWETLTGGKFAKFSQSSRNLCFFLWFIYVFFLWFGWCSPIFWVKNQKKQRFFNMLDWFVEKMQEKDCVFWFFTEKIGENRWK